MLHPSALRSSTLSTPISLSFECTYTFVSQELWIHICKFTDTRGFTHTYITARTPGLPHLRDEVLPRAGFETTVGNLYLLITGGTPYRLGYRGRRLYNYHSRPMSEHKACVWQLVVHTTVCHNCSYGHSALTTGGYRVERTSSSLTSPTIGLSPAGEVPSDISL